MVDSTAGDGRTGRGDTSLAATLAGERVTASWRERRFTLPTSSGGVLERVDAAAAAAAAAAVRASAASAASARAASASAFGLK